MKEKTTQPSKSKTARNDSAKQSAKRSVIPPVPPAFLTRERKYIHLFTYRKVKTIRVSAQKNNKVYRRYFSPLKYGGWDAALEAALAYRITLVHKLNLIIED